MNKNVAIVLVAVMALFGLGYFVNHSKKEKENEKAEKETKRINRLNELKEELDKEWKYCNVKAAEDNFNDWFNFTYPDWKIKGEVAVIDDGDCTYKLRFTGVNPHFAKLGVIEEEVIIVRISYFNNFEEFQIETIRGTLY